LVGWSLAACALALAVLALAMPADAERHYAVSLGASTAAGDGGPPYDPAPTRGVVALTNMDTASATVTMAGAGIASSASVPPGGTTLVTMPLAAPSASGLYPDMGYLFDGGHLVGAALFQDLTQGPSDSATRLVPESKLGLDHYAITAMGPLPNFITVLATYDMTRVTVTVTAAVNPGGAVPAMPAGSSQTFLLNALDVLQVEADGDLTGSRVQADRPVAMFSGDRCAYLIPGTCDMAADAIPPTTSVGTTYVLCTSTVARPGEGAYDRVRIIGTQPGTTVTVTPTPVGPTGPFTLNAGDVVETYVDKDTVVQSTGPVLVGRIYDRPGTTGNPALIIDRPVARYETLHGAFLPTGWEHYVSIAAPDAANAAVDGVPVGGWRSITGTGQKCGTVQPAAGTHLITSDAPTVAQVLSVRRATAAVPAEGRTGTWWEAPSRGERPPLAKAAIEWVRTACTDSSIRVRDDGSAAIPPATVAGREWDFGDGARATGAAATHTYAAPGTYTITLEVRDSNNLVGRAYLVVDSVGHPSCPPTLDDPGYLRTVAGDVFRHCPYGKDPEGDRLTYTAEDLPPGATADALGCITWTPADDQVRVWTGLRYTASDGTTTVFRTFTIEVGARDPAASPAPDRDDDGIQDVADNCPDDPNREQEDADRDGRGDPCDLTPGTSTSTSATTKPTRAARPGDRDGDRLLDGVDNCPDAVNPDQHDIDLDGLGDKCDGDADGDGIPDKDIAWPDNCASVPNADQADQDGDGQGDACEKGLQAAAEKTAQTAKPAELEPNARPLNLVPMWIMATVVAVGVFLALPFALYAKLHGKGRGKER
jgi:PKD repeat protein